MREFQVNEYITLKLENSNTNIYVNDYIFNQCNALLLDIPTDKIDSFDEIESIDDSIKSKDITIHKDTKISPQTEFWGHCSNLQAWYENNYDTRLLHYNLAFPLLKKLTDVGDAIAKKVFKEEIVKRLLSGNKSVIMYLILNGYITYFNEEELKTLCEDPKCPKLLINNLREYLKIFEEIHENKIEFIASKLEIIESLYFPKNIFLKNLDSDNYLLSFITREDEIKLFCYPINNLSVKKAIINFTALTFEILKILSEFKLNKELLNFPNDIQIEQSYNVGMDIFMHIIEFYFKESNIQIIEQIKDKFNSVSNCVRLDIREVRKKKP